MAEPKITRTILEAAIASGKGLTEAAEFLGVPHSAFIRAEKRFGIYFDRRKFGGAPDRGPTDYRAVVQDMKPLDAVEYLLGELEHLLRPPGDCWILPGVDLTPDQRRILRFMVEQAPRWVTREALLRVISGSRHEDEWPDIKIVDVHISRMRSRTAHLGVSFPRGPWGSGSWSVVWPEEFVWPWEENEGLQGLAK